MVADPPPPTTVAVLGITLAGFLGLHVLVLQSAWQVETERLPRTGLLLALAVVGLVAAVVGFQEGPYGWVWLALPGVAASDALIALPGRRARTWLAAIVAATALPVLVTGGPDLRWRPALGAAVVVWAVANLESAGLWLWRRTVATEQARRDAVELAAVRERLRLTEDLHDVLGHALEVVAFKSELAARLLDRDPARAHAQMVEVQRLARSSVEDVRALVRARRPVDLRREVDASRTLLTSAGVECRVDDDAVDAVPPALRDVLGRVVREAVTNLLRHADATWCAVTVTGSDSDVVLEVANDGVREAAPDGEGSGLAGMRDRLAEVGGALEVDVADGQFRVRASAPRPDAA